MPKNDNPSEEELLAEAVIFIEGFEASRLTGGPKTEAGKRISSRNSRKHGLMSKDIERRFDEGLDLPDWLFALADQLRAMADESDPTDGHLLRKALIAAWRASLAQTSLDMEMSASVYPAHDKERLAITRQAAKLSYYAARFRAERDNAIRRLRQRSRARSGAG